MFSVMYHHDQCSVSPGMDFKQGGGLCFMNINENLTHRLTNEHTELIIMLGLRIQPIHALKKLIARIVFFQKYF